jgi:hypothetical protein
LLVIALYLTNSKEKLVADESLRLKSDDITKVINSLSTAISITNDVFNHNQLAIATQGLIKKEDVICSNERINEMIELASQNSEPLITCPTGFSLYDKKIFL